MPRKKKAVVEDRTLVEPGLSVERQDSEPDNTCASSIHGGGDHPEATKWKYKDSKLKRPVHISVKKWYGDAHHWYASIDEADDELWIPPCPDYPDGRWWRPNDRRRVGEKFQERFLSETAAYKYVELILRDHFSPKTHKFIKVSGLAETSRYTFREGD